MATEAHRTAQSKKAFLAAFRESGIITSACEASGVGRRTVYDWQEQDAQFVQDFRQAEIESTELLEKEAIRRARDGVLKETPIYHNGQLIDTITEYKYSDTLLIFMLKGRKPDTYRDNINVTVRQEAEQLAKQYGLDVDEIIREAERLAAANASDTR